MDDYESQLVDGVRGTVDRLNVLWTQISMEPRMRQARTQLVFDHIHDLLEEIVSISLQSLYANCAVLGNSRRGHGAQRFGRHRSASTRYVEYR